MKSGQKEKPAVSCGVTGPTGAAGLGDAPNNKEQKNVVRIRFGSSARHDRYLTELPKIREKKGGKQTKGRKKGNQKAAAKNTTAFEKASHAPRRGSPRPRNSVCRSSDWNVRMLSTKHRRAAPAFSLPHTRASMTRFRGTRCFDQRAGPALRSYSTEQAPGLVRVRDFHPVPLFSGTRMRVRRSGSRTCHKSRSVYSLVTCAYYSGSGMPPSSPYRAAMHFFYHRGLILPENRPRRP